MPLAGARAQGRKGRKGREGKGRPLAGRGRKGEKVKAGRRRGVGAERREGKGRPLAQERKGGCVKTGVSKPESAADPRFLTQKNP